MEKGGLSYLVILIIWGAVLYFLFYNSSFMANSLSGNFFASLFSSVDESVNTQEGIIGLFDGQGNFKDAVVHFNKKPDISDIKISLDDSKFYFAGSDYGLFISRDQGLNWYSFSDVEHKIDFRTRIYKILFASSTQAFISVFYNDQGTVYKSRDNFFSLEKILDFDNEAAYALAFHDAELYLGLSSGRLLVYSLKTNDCRALTSFDAPITNLSVNPDGSIYLVLKDNGFWVSRNQGQSFNQMNFLNDYKGADKIQDFVVSLTDSSLIYALTDYGFIRSLDSGANWQVFRSLPEANPEISALALRPNPGEVYAASGDKVYTSLNRGLSWQILDADFIDRIISAIRPNKEEIIVGTSNN